MENVVVKDAILDKKLNEWGYEHKDYVAQGELTVEITLREYRDLITDKAKSQYKVDEVLREKADRQAEIAELKSQIISLNAVITNLKTSITGVSEANVYKAEDE